MNESWAGIWSNGTGKNGGERYIASSSRSEPPTGRGPQTRIDALGVEERREEAEPLDVVEVQVREDEVELPDLLAASAAPSERMPVPASSTTIAPDGVRTSTQLVLPP